MNSLAKACAVIPALVLLAGASLLAWLVVIALYLMESHPVSLSRLSRVEVGATPGAVEDLLGKPTRVQSSPSGDTFWEYSSRYQWCMVTVRFDNAGDVIDVVHDH